LHISSNATRLAAKSALSSTTRMRRTGFPSG
jgi:hypothetical protein